MCCMVVADSDAYLHTFPLLSVSELTDILMSSLPKSFPQAETVKGPECTFAYICQALEEQYSIFINIHVSNLSYL